MKNNRTFQNIRYTKENLVEAYKVGTVVNKPYLYSTKKYGTKYNYSYKNGKALAPKRIFEIMLLNKGVEAKTFGSTKHLRVALEKAGFERV